MDFPVTEVRNFTGRQRPEIMVSATLTSVAVSVDAAKKFWPERAEAVERGSVNDVQCLAKEVKHEPTDDDLFPVGSNFVLDILERFSVAPGRLEMAESFWADMIVVVKKIGPRWSQRLSHPRPTFDTQGASWGPGELLFLVRSSGLRPMGTLDVPDMMSGARANHESAPRPFRLS